jgi:hypothetical protein
MSSRARLRWAARLRSVGIFSEERRIAVRPYLVAPPSGWLSPFLPLSYSRVWEHLGAAGMHYVSVNLSGTSEPLPILDPTSSYYHAWFGVYAVAGSNGPFGFAGGVPQPEKLLPLVVADQRNWQKKIIGRSLADPVFTFKSEAQAITLPRVTERAFLYFARFSSNSVLIRPEEQAPAARSFFRLPDSGRWGSLVDPAHPIQQEGFVAVWADAARGVTFCIYGAGSSYVDKAGVLHDYAKQIEPELLSLLFSVGLKQVRG